MWYRVADRSGLLLTGAFLYKKKLIILLYIAVFTQCNHFLAESEVATRMVFADRDIQDQLVCEENSSDMVLWYRKCIEVLEGEGTVEKREFKVSDCGNESIICCYILFFLQALQHVFAAVLSLNSLKELIRSGRLEDFVATRKLSYSVPSSTLVLIIFGNNSRQVGLACPVFCYMF